MALFTIEELKQKVDEDNFIEGIINVDISSLIDGDLEDTLDLFGIELVGSDLLMDITYEVVGATDGLIMIKVGGDCSMILESED